MKKKIIFSKSGRRRWWLTYLVLRLVHQGGRKRKLGIIAVTTVSSYTNITSHGLSSMLSRMSSRENYLVKYHVGNMWHLHCLQVGGPFLTLPRLHCCSLLAITKLSSTKDTPVPLQSLSLRKLPECPDTLAVSHLLTLGSLEDCWLHGICPEARPETAERKDKEKKTTL